MKNLRPLGAAALLGIITVTGSYAQMKAGAPQPTPVSAPAVTHSEDAESNARRISIKEAQQLVKAKKAVYVDVRSKEQYDLGHIKGALSIPGFAVTTRAKEIPPEKTIILYCA